MLTLKLFPKGITKTELLKQLAPATHKYSRKHKRRSRTVIYIDYAAKRSLQRLSNYHNQRIGTVVRRAIELYLCREEVRHKLKSLA